MDPCELSLRPKYHRVWLGTAALINYSALTPPLACSQWNPGLEEPGRSGSLGGGGSSGSAHSWAGPDPRGPLSLGLTQGRAILQGQFWAHTPTATCSSTALGSALALRLSFFSDLKIPPTESVSSSPTSRECQGSGRGGGNWDIWSKYPQGLLSGPCSGPLVTPA